MDRSDDEDRVLRSLGADLARDDPRLAALLSGGPARRGRPRRAWLLLALPLLAGLVLLPITTAVGIVVVLLAVAAPLAVLLSGPGSDEKPVPGVG